MVKGIQYADTKLETPLVTKGSDFISGQKHLTNKLFHQVKETNPK